MNLIEFGDCREILRRWKSEGVRAQMCVTSPPYFGLRDYGVDGQLGMEATPDEFVQNLVEVFRAVRDVLRDDGTVWLNLGDSYSSNGGSHGLYENNQPGVGAYRVHSEGAGNKRIRTAPAGLKPKDLIGIPWRVAFALQSDGWYLRQDIIWAKPNPMPESVTDRCTKSHEYIFLLSKSARYFYDHEAIKEKAISSQAGGIGNKASSKRKGTGLESDIDYVADGKRNRRSVWTVPTQPFAQAHFAVFPEKLVEPCILAGSPKGGIVLDPFMGSGTTAVVAIENGRQYLGCELNPEYKAMQDERIKRAHNRHAVKSSSLF